MVTAPLSHWILDIVAAFLYPSNRKGWKGARSLIWEQFNRKPTISCEVSFPGKKNGRHFVQLQALGTFLSFTASLCDTTDSSTGMNFPAVSTTGVVDCWSCSWRFPRVPPPFPGKGRREMFKKENSLCLFCGFVPVWVYKCVFCPNCSCIF